MWHIYIYNDVFSDIFFSFAVAFPPPFLTVWTTLGCDLPGGKKSRHTGVRSLRRRR
jgi:hypothetical protein